MKVVIWHTTENHNYDIKKCLLFAVRYTTADIEDGKRLEKYLKTIDLSTNAYLKKIIKEDLDRKGFKYSNEND